MSERNVSKKHASKDKIPVKDIRKNAISKDRTKKAAEKTGEHPGKSSITMYRIWMALWMLLCAVLLVRIWSLNHTIESLKAKIGSLTQMIVEQRDRLEKLAETSDARQENGLDSESLPNEWLQADAAAVSGQGIAGTGGQSGTGEGQGAFSDRQIATHDEQDEARKNQADNPEEITAAHKVYLTFDDGPSEYTEEILDILDKYGVKATFFVVGREGSQAEEALRKIVEAGHTLGMHSYTHKYGEVYASIESFAADLGKEQDYLFDITGVKSTIYRFPGGSSNTVSEIDMREFAEYLDSQGVRFFDWNISSGDGGSFLVPVEMLIENCTATIKDHGTSVVLMHDAAGKTTTREALPIIIETIQAMDDTVLLPITDDTMPVQHIQWQGESRKESSGRDWEKETDESQAF